MQRKKQYHLNRFKFLAAFLTIGFLFGLSWSAEAVNPGDVVINEVLASHSGTDDTEFVELFGTPGYSLSGLSLIVVEGDAFDPGRIDRRFDFKPFHQIGANGFFLYGNCSGLDVNYSVTPDASLFNNYFENSSLTVALVETASLVGDAGDLISGSEVVRSAIALSDGDPDDEFFFDAPVIGPDGDFFPAGARRLTDGVDTGSVADWEFADFFLPGNNSPTGGGLNGCETLELTISEVQGAGHVSPYVGSIVATGGIVTAIAFNGFYLQDPDGDGDANTSDGIFVFTDDAPSVDVGDEVELTGVVLEFIPGGAETGNLSITQITSPETKVLSGSNSLPAPVIIGTGGRIPPAVDVISKSERPVNLQEVPGVFNPDNNGIDFYESLEGMLVTIEDPVAVSATRTFSPFSSEMFTLTNNGANIEPGDARTARGGIELQPDPNNDGDQNPERVQIQFDPTISGGASVPAITVGDRLDNVTGVVGYNFGNFEINATQQVTFISSGLGRETTALSGAKKAVTVASYNVLNLSPLATDDNQRATLAAQIVNNLGTPDVIALQEIQDNNGTVDDGTTDATETLQELVDAIADAGGPKYKFFDVAPEDGTSGGVPGGNIRNAFLYNSDRVKLVDFVSLSPDVLGGMGVSNPNAFDGTRDPLQATFKFRGKEFTVINNHLTSRFGSTPIFGGPQPFVQAGEDEREAQVGALNEVVNALLAAGRGNQNNASKAGRIVVLGDLNTFEFTNDLTEILPGTGANRVLTNLIGSLDDDNVYTFIFDGNSQVLDHVFVTDNLLPGAEIDIVHLNVDFPRVDDTVGSDHEPIVVRFDLDTAQ
jgi:predicted extracellular nuclease